MKEPFLQCLHQQQNPLRVEIFHRSLRGLRLQVDMLGFQNRTAVEQQMRAMQQAHGGVGPGAGAGAPPPPGMPAQ